MTAAELVDLLGPIVAVLAGVPAAELSADSIAGVSRDRVPGFHQDATVVVRTSGPNLYAAGIAEQCAVARSLTSVTAAAHGCGQVGWAVPLVEARRVLAVARRWQCSHAEQVLQVEVRSASVQITASSGQVLLVARRPANRSVAVDAIGERMRQSLAALDAQLAAAQARGAAGTGRRPQLRIMRRDGGRYRAVHGAGLLGLHIVPPRSSAAQG
jgi:hypothetical protein